MILFIIPTVFISLVVAQQDTLIQFKLLNPTLTLWVQIISFILSGALLILAVRYYMSTTALREAWSFVLTGIILLGALDVLPILRIVGFMSMPGLANVIKLVSLAFLIIGFYKLLQKSYKGNLKKKKK